MRIIILVDQQDQRDPCIASATEAGTLQCEGHVLNVLHSPTWDGDSNLTVEIDFNNDTLHIQAGECQHNFRVSDDEVVGIVISHFRRYHGGGGLSAFQALQFMGRPVARLEYTRNNYYQEGWTRLFLNPCICLTATFDGLPICVIIGDFRNRILCNLNRLDQYLSRLPLEGFP